MLGMENLLSSMIGIKPDDMRVIFEGLLKDAGESVAALKRIEENQLKIIAKLETKNHDNGNNGND